MLAERTSRAGKATRQAVLACCALLGISVVWAAWNATASPAGAALALVLVLLLPLLAPLPGLVRGQRRTYAWATLSVIPYFVYGIVEVIAAPTGRAASACVLFAALALFIALIAHLRATRGMATER